MNRLVLFLVCGLAAAVAGARQGEIRPGELWRDTAGHVINAKADADVTDPRSTLPGTPKRGADGKFHGVPGNTEGPKRCWIDHVFYTPGSIHATRQSVVVDQDALDASDHSPVIVDFEFR